MEVKNNKTSLVLYGNLLSDIKTRIRQAQVKATFSANSEMILMYWDIGRMIQERQDHEGWGTAVIPRLARDIRNELPEEKGFSERNIKRMLRFYREYPNILPIMPQAVAQLQQAENKDVLKVPQPVDQLPVNEKRTFGNFAAACCTNPLGSQYSAHGKGQRPIQPFLVYGSNHSKWLEP